jgi:ABC-2 type transport system permease protein
MRGTPTARSLLIAVVLLAAAAVVATFVAANSTGTALTDITVVRTAMHTSTVSTMILSLMAAIVSGTGDFRHGRIDQLLLTTPIRSRVVVVKAWVAACTGLLFGVAGALSSAATAWVVLALSGQSLDFGQKIVAQPLVGVVVGAPLLALVGTGLALVARNQSGTIGSALGWLLLIEPLVGTAAPDVAKWLPFASGLALTYSPNAGLLGPTFGGVVLAADAALSVVIARIVLARTDV